MQPGDGFRQLLIVGRDILQIEFEQAQLFLDRELLQGSLTQIGQAGGRSGKRVALRQLVALIGVQIAGKAEKLVIGMRHFVQ